MKQNEISTQEDEIELRITQTCDQPSQGKPQNNDDIDLIDLMMRLWNQRKKIGIWCGIGALIGIVIAFSIPKEYDTSVRLVPEIVNNQQLGGGIGAMAAMVGFGGVNPNGTDAVNPQLYPDVVASIPFLVDLFNVPVEGVDGTHKTTVRQYIEDDQKSTWWSVLFSLPFKALGAIRGNNDTNSDPGKKIDAFQLTTKEYDVVRALSRRIKADVDTKTSVITITVEMQDPMISATLADTVVNRLREYITNYRTNKARQDLEYAELLDREAKENYYKAQQEYANYQDRNQGLILYSAQTTRDRLENEATLAFNLYNQTSEQVQLAKAKVQENTPVYTTLTPATVPLRPASPKKVLIIIGFIFLAFIFSSCWILYGKGLSEDLKKKKVKD